MVSVDDVDAPPEPELLASLSRGDSAAFDRNEDGPWFRRHDEY
jgi:hypothetical protein